MDPSGHKSILSAYYSCSKGSGSFTVQAKNSPYYFNYQAKFKAIVRKNDFIKMWNGLNSSIKTLVLYLHGGIGFLYFFKSSISAKEIKKLKKKKLNRIYLLSCNGARGKESVARALFNRTGKGTQIYASMESVSYRRDSTRNQNRPCMYLPRYPEEYCKRYGYRYYFQNPVKRCYF